MSKTEITLITGNEDKVREFERLLGIRLNHQKLDLPEIQATDVREVARAKAEKAYELLGRPCLVDDTGLTISAWGQLPGALIHWFLDNVGNEGILKMLAPDKPRAAHVTTALGYCDEYGSKIFEGELKGEIAPEPRGKNGFGYDSIFMPEGRGKTFAEMTNKQKDAISMRAMAAAAMKADMQLASR